VGLHLGAGPYLLLYSRALLEGAELLDLHWPPPIKACPILFVRMPKYLPDCSHQIDVENHNRVLLEQLQCSEAESHANQDKEIVLTYPEDDRMESMDVLC
jgi:hypothetical protein